MNRSLVAVLTAVLAACDRDATTAPSSVLAGMPMTNRESAAEGLFVPGWNEVRCFEARALGKWDPDGDTMDNRCEDALAAAFAPGLVVARDCNYDEGVGRQGGEYYYGVQPYQDGSNTVVRIAYLPAYYWDCGSPTQGPFPLPDVCPGCFADGHDGDSEFFIVDVQFNDTTRHWETRQIFLSAHCGTPTGQRCMWYPDPASTFSWVDGTVRGAPIIWVADGKHGNYSSREDCDAGGLAGSDTCDQNHTFYGWQGLEQVGSTAYSDILAQYAGW